VIITVPAHIGMLEREAAERAGTIAGGFGSATGI
jgi:molecular chaperone DnaK (HSP70)